jgi:2-keto-3-deoxy-L-rhamnonate aldolase RhmA
MEHSARSIESARTCILAANSSDIPMVVRVMERDQQFLVEQMLDGGAQGVLVPTVETKEQALNVVKHARYAPEGERGIAGSVPIRRWLDAGPDYRAIANKNVFVSVIIETPLAFENLSDMLTVDGIDAWMPGPGDLSTRLGLPIGDPKVTATLEDGFRKIAAAGKVGWAATTNPDPVRLRTLGGKMTLIGSDSAAIVGARSLLTAARAALEAKA